jgi:hypothetical protein
MTPTELSDALEMAAVKAGTAHQLFSHDGWRFLVEQDLERSGFHVKLEFLFFYAFFIAANNQRRYHSRMEHTSTVFLTGNEDQQTRQNVAQALIAKASFYAREHAPTDPIPE